MANTPQIILKTDNRRNWRPRGVELSSLSPIVAGNAIIFGLRPDQCDMYKDVHQVEVPETDRVICLSVEDGSIIGHGIYCAIGYDVRKVVACEKDGKLCILALFSMERTYDREKAIRWRLRAHVFEIGRGDQFGRLVEVDSSSGSGRVTVVGGISGYVLYALYKYDGSDTLHFKVFNWGEDRLLLYEPIADNGSAENLDFVLIYPGVFAFPNLYTGNIRFGHIHFDRSRGFKIRKLRTLGLPQHQGSNDMDTMYGKTRFLLGSRAEDVANQPGPPSDIFVVSFGMNAKHTRSYLVTIRLDQLLEAIGFQGDDAIESDHYQSAVWGLDDLLCTPWNQWGEQRASLELAEEPDHISGSELTPVEYSHQVLVKLVGSKRLEQRDTLVIKDFNRDAVLQFSNQRHDLPSNTKVSYPIKFNAPEEQLISSSLPCVEGRTAWVRTESEKHFNVQIWLKGNRIIIYRRPKLAGLHEEVQVVNIEYARKPICN